MPQYLISCRQIDNGQFIAEPAAASYLEIPDDATQADPLHIIGAARWLATVRDLADGKADGIMSSGGDILVFIHGYNNSPQEILQRHRILQKNLDAANWHGIVISFDWPCENSTLNYLEDRSDASEAANLLISHGLRLLGEVANKDCQTNIHLLGHSTGAFVIMKAFEKANDFGDLYRSAWRIAQVAFIGGDVASDSLDNNSASNQNMFERISRLTNYQNGYDWVLASSNAKRLGTSPRVGRVGLSPNAHPKAININCSAFFNRTNPDLQKDKLGCWPHSWHIGNPIFALDLAMTLEGRIDRHLLPTRVTIDGQLCLTEGKRPEYETQWR